MSPDLFRRVYSHPAVGERELAEIVSAHRKVYFTRQQYFLRQGSRADEYFLLEEGIVRAFVYDPEGKEMTIQFFGPGVIVIDASSLFQRIPGRTNLQAVTDCSAWKITYADFQGLFASFPGIPEWGRVWMTNELFKLQQRTIDMITLSATDRYVNLVEEQPEIVREVPLKFIASYLGVTDTSLSRIRREIATR